MKKILLLCIILVCLGGAFLFAGGQTEAEKTEKQKVDELPVINLGYPINIGVVVNDYIIEKGLDKENGFVLNQIIFPTGVAINEAIAANEVDLGGTGTGGLFAMKNLDAQWIADCQVQANGIGIFARPDSEMAQVLGYNEEYPDLYGSPETVRGKTILTTVGTIGQLMVLKWLEKIGVKESEVEIAHMEFPQAYQAFDSGQGDAANLIPTLSYQGLDKGWVEVASLAALKIDLKDGLILNPKSVPKKREAIVNYLRVWYETAEMFNTTPGLKEEWGAAFFERNGMEVDPKWLAFQAETWPYHTAEEFKTGKIDLGEWLKLQIDFYISNGTLEESFLKIYEDNVNEEYLKEALNY